MDETSGLKTQRVIAKRHFTRALKSVNGPIACKAEADLINEKKLLLINAWQSVQEKHDAYVVSTYPDDEEKQLEEDGWISELQDLYEKVDHNILLLKQNAESFKVDSEICSLRTARTRNALLLRLVLKRQ